MKTETAFRSTDLRDVVIVGAARTAQGRLLGQLATLSAVELGGAAIAGALARAGVPADIVDAVIMGQVLQSGAGQNPARQSAVAAGIPLSAPAVTVNKVCLSGLSAIIEAARMLRLGDATVVVAGGQESMSQAPRLVAGTRTGSAYGALTLVDAAAWDGLTDAFDHEAMGLATDRANSALGISRVSQDAVAVSSHLRAAAAQESGVWAQEIIPVKVPTRKGVLEVSLDEGIRPDASQESLARLRPAFSPTGTVTAGNASPLTDGAAAVVLTTRETAQRHGWDVIAALRAHGQIAGPDTSLPDKPAKAIQTALEREGWTAEELDLVEINEAFASVVSHSGALLGVPDDRINIHGGAIGIGHPIGASGARLVVTAVHELIRREAGRAAVALCGGGGQGDALLLER
ncbi:acetyl-CoA C-acetyltransferase [Pseudarthrobacter oxydans]|uniref:Probable acetyl-CoA acetyltransferase n=1 Tax=Pseudarthrobacter oxydans TaxID=1671 RepID=A0AAW8NHI6_PSEOX|nr:acetyl-CoA C-acyltransferase [Pseudarthrobacter oxydans]MDR7166205.1 acetyl-CoA C-acetyltransferase [Pseudarthrobacter oxydans]